MCSTDVYCSKQTSGNSTKGNHHPSFSSFLELGRRKLSMQPKFVAAQKMLLKRNPNIRKWIARFYYFRHLCSLERVCVLTIIAWICPSCRRSICTALSSGFLPVVLHSDQPLSEGEIIPFSGVCQSGGELHYPRRRRWWLHALTDRLARCATDDDLVLIIAEHHFFSLHQLTPSCILHRAQQHHADASACQ